MQSQKKQEIIKPNIYSIYKIRPYFFDVDNWHFSPNEIKVENDGWNAISIESVNAQAKYVTFIDKSKNFSCISDVAKKITFHSTNTIMVNGKKSQGLHVTIYLIEYDKQCQQVKKHKIPLNTKTTITSHDSTQFARLAIRLEGIGKVSLSDFFVSPFVPLKSKTNESKINRLSNIKVLGILSKYNMKGFSKVFTVIPFAEYNPDKLFKSNKPDFLLIDPEGLKNFVNIEGNEDLLYHLLLWFKTNEIPSIYWINQPLNDVDFNLELVSLFDFLFTANQADLYEIKHALRQKHVHYVMNAGNAVLMKTKNGKKPIHIYLEEDQMESNSFKEELFEQDIVVDYYSMKDNYLPQKLFRDLAAGTPVITNIYKLRKYFREAVLLANDKKEIADYIWKLKNNQQFYRKISVNSIREIHRSHSFLCRAEEMVELIGIPYRAAIRNVTLLFFIQSKADFYKALDIANSQTYERIKVVMIIAVFDGYEKIINQFNSEKLTFYMQEFAYEHYNFADIITTNYISILQPNYEYGEHFIEDMMYVIQDAKVKMVGRKLPNEKTCLELAPIIKASEGVIDEFTAIYETSLLDSERICDMAYHQKAFLKKNGRHDNSDHQ